MEKAKNQPDIPGDRDIIYYDGRCGLCHALVRKIIAADEDGKRFVFASLQGPFIKGELSEQARSALPDSIVVQRAVGQRSANKNGGLWRPPTGFSEALDDSAPAALLVESDAVVYIAGRLGGWHRFIAQSGYLLPRGMRDFLYRMVARVRRRLVAPPTGACPVVDPEMMRRFLD